jgi:hypothetical protein
MDEDFDKEMKGIGQSALPRHITKVRGSRIEWIADT